jgi:molybdenum-dependent DNA-binding transcriptional regulator ModE
MNIYSALRSSKRAHLIKEVRKYINDDGFVSILESIDIDNPASIRQACRELDMYMKVPYIRPRISAWIHGY